VRRASCSSEEPDPTAKDPETGARRADRPIAAWNVLVSCAAGSRDDYRDVLEPALNQALQSGELRLMFVLTDFEGLEAGAWLEDMKTGLKAWVREHSAWRRFALVTDVERVVRAMRLFAWVAPGEVMTYGLDQVQQAKSWVAG
jgi:SpoIIAA-like